MGDNFAQIVDRSGKLFVLEPWRNHFSQPIQYQTAWPTGLETKNYLQLVGKEVKHFSEGTYRFNDGLMLRLEHGGRTRPDKNESKEKPIPKPKGCREYYNGRWIK